jgi:ankyrin repeat protein
MDNEAVLLVLLARDDVVMAQRNVVGDTPLHVFCRHASSDKCLSLGTKMIDRGAPVNARNNRGETPLHSMVLNDARAGITVLTF